MLWRTTQVPSEGAVHVHPLKDLVQHELTDDCVCGPRTELHKGSGKPDLYAFIHHALDGRKN